MKRGRRAGEKGSRRKSRFSSCPFSRNLLGFALLSKSLPRDTRTRRRRIAPLLYFHLVSLVGESNRWRDRIAPLSLFLSRATTIAISPFRFFLPPDVYRRSRALRFRRFIFCPSAKYPPRRAAISGHDDQREKRAAPTPRFELVGGGGGGRISVFRRAEKKASFFSERIRGKMKSNRGVSNYFYPPRGW